MQGYDDDLASKFLNSWMKGKVTIGSLSFMLTPPLIVDVTSFENDGLGIVKKCTGKYQIFIKKFLEEGEQVQRFQNGYKILNIPPYALVSLHIMRYLTLEGQYMMVHDYDFPILNHVRHREEG